MSERPRSSYILTVTSTPQDREKHRHLKTLVEMEIAAALKQVFCIALPSIQVIGNSERLVFFIDMDGQIHDIDQTLETILSGLTRLLGYDHQLAVELKQGRTASLASR